MNEQGIMKTPIGEETYRKLEAIAKDLNLSVAECADQIVNEFLDHSERVDVTVEIPKRWMRLLEGENYFGWAKQEFFTNSVKTLISCVLAEMNTEAKNRLNEKYGYDIDKAAYAEAPDC